MIGRVNVIIGAGAILDCNPEMSTMGITDIVCGKPNFEAINPEGKAAHHIWNARQKLEEALARKINFEEIYQALLDVAMYKCSFEDNDTPIDRIVLTPRTSVNLDHLDYTMIRIMMNRIMWMTSGNISSYSRNSPPSWFSDFFHTLSSGKVKLSIFNLNYDNWVEQSIKTFNDGFEKKEKTQDYATFNDSLCISYDNDHIINHIHGSVYFNYSPAEIPDEGHIIYKYDNTISSTGAVILEKGQNGLIFRSPIVTGLNKTENILFEPYNCYLSNLIREIVRNDAAIIIGYGFKDQHINDQLHAYDNASKKNKKVIIISPTIKKNIFDAFAAEEKQTKCGKIQKTESESVVWFEGSFKDATNDKIFMSIIGNLVK